MSAFDELESTYATLRARVQSGELSQERYLQYAAKLMCQDESGRWWTIHPETGVWYYRWQEAWHPGVPPGHVPAATRVLAPLAPLPPREESLDMAGERADDAREGGSRWWVAVAALVLVIAVLAVAFVVVLPWLSAIATPSDSTPKTDSPITIITLAPTVLGGVGGDTGGTVEPAPAPTGPSVEPFDVWGGLRPAWPEVQDDFSRADSGWSRGVGGGRLVDYRDGQLRVELANAGLSGWSRYDSTAFGDGWVEVTVSEMSSEAGIALHVTEDYYGYVFRIDYTGRYAIGRTLPDAEPPLVGWTYSASIYTAGKPNRLAVVAEDGRRYRFYVNGELVHQVEDTAHPFGVVALWAGSSNHQTAWAAFDDWRLRVAPSTGGLEPTADVTQPAVTPSAAPSATPVPQVTGTVTPVLSATLPVPVSLAFEVDHDAWFPGSGGLWVTRLRIQATGGDEPYSFWVAGQRIAGSTLDVLWPCGSDLVTEVVVESADGQRAVKSLWVPQVSCTVP